MFRKIQHQLLLRYPLLWNLRIVPLLAVGLLFNILFFTAGLIYGAIDFGPDNDSYYIDATPVIAIMLSIVLSALIIIIWLVFYLRNNAFKSFYPQGNTSLYKEWLLILLVFIMNCCYPLSFLYGEDVRGRGYFAEEELSHRLDVISMAALFADGGFQDDGEYYVEQNGETVLKQRNYITYRNKRYPLRSLFNRPTGNFSYQAGKDSLNEIRVKNWLYENRKDSVLWLMREFDKIVKSHNAPTNVTPEKWLELVYDYPDFTNYITVGRVERYEAGEPMMAGEYSADTIAVEVPDMDDEATKWRNLDTISNNIRIIDSIMYVYPKYVVPLRQLEYAYADVSRSYTDPLADWGVMTACTCIALGISLLLFSFRVTSGRTWLISLVAFGVTALLIGILNFLMTRVTPSGSFFRRNDEEAYFIWWIVIVIILLAYFFSKRQTKGKSGIILNVLLWLTPWVLPVLIFVSAEITGYFTWRRITNEELDYWQLREVYKSPYEAFVDDNPGPIMAGCFVAFILFMYFFTKSIKRWKGVAES